MPLQIYLEHAEELAYVIINAGADIDCVLVPEEASALLDKACCYLSAEKIADNGRNRGNLTEQEAANESATRLSLAEACSTFDDKHASKFLDCISRIPSRGGSSI